MKIKVNDEVKILAGKDRGKTGKVIKTLRKQDKVIVEGINIVKKHQKPSNANNNVGSIVEMAAPIHVSNVKKIETVKEVKAKKTTSKKEKESK